MDIRRYAEEVEITIGNYLYMDRHWDDSVEVIELITRTSIRC